MFRLIATLKRGTAASLVRRAERGHLGPSSSRSLLLGYDLGFKGKTEMPHDLLIDTYDTERIKVISVWSEFTDEDLSVRPRPGDPRGRSVHEQMVHQCVSEDFWFRTMFGIEVGAPPLPTPETRIEFIKRYAEDSGKRLAPLGHRDDRWWGENVTFFDVQRSRAWH